MAESAVERHLKAGVEQGLGGWCVKMLPFYSPGLPDRILFLPGGRVALVELKDRGKDWRKTQKRVRDKLKRLGFTVHLLDTKEKVEEFLMGFVKRSNAKDVARALRYMEEEEDQT